MRVLHLILIILLIQSCRPTVKDLKQKYSAEAINYFYETAFLEDDKGKRKSISRWNKNIYIYSSGNVSTDDIFYTKNAIAQLDSLQLPIGIYLTTDSLIADIHIYFGDYQYLRKKGIEDRDSGFFVGMGIIIRKFYIESAIVGISSDAPEYKKMNNADSIKLRQSVILEEITQCLGITGDSWLYPDHSIFYEGIVAKLNISPIDKEIIQFLYDPLVPPNYTIEQFEKDFKDVLHHIDAVPKIIKHMSDNNIPLSYLKYIREKCFRNDGRIKDSILIKWPSKIYIRLEGELQNDSIFFENVLTAFNSVSDQFRLSLTDDNDKYPIISMFYIQDDTLKDVVMRSGKAAIGERMFPRRKKHEVNIAVSREKNNSKSRNESMSYFLYNALSHNENDENFEIMDVDSLGNISLKHDYKEILKLMYEPVFYSGISIKELDKIIEILTVKGHPEN